MMRFSQFLIVMVLTIVSVSGAPTNNEIQAVTYRRARSCAISMRYWDGCNTCVCDLTKSEVCTNFVCFRRDSRGRNVPVEKLEAPEEFWDNSDNIEKPKIYRRSCRIGAIYNDGCNTCRCDKHGQPSCTEKLCFRRDSRGLLVPMEKLLAPADFWDYSNSR